MIQAVFPLKGFNIIILVILFIIFNASPVLSAGPNSLSLFKEQLIRGLDEKMTAIQKECKALSFASSEFHISPRDWRKMCHRRVGELKYFRRWVRRTPPDELPQKLVTIFVDKPNPAMSSLDVLPYIISLGELGIPALSREYERVDPGVRERILIVVGNIRSPQGLPLVRRGLDDGNERVTLFAQSTLRLILGSQAKPELMAFLTETRSSWAIQHTLKELVLTGDRDWWDTFFVWVERGKLALSDVTSFSREEECPEEAVGRHIPLLLNVMGRSENPHIVPSDIHLSGEILSMIHSVQHQDALVNVVLSNFEPSSLKSLKAVRDPTELTGEHEQAVLDAFTKTVNDKNLFSQIFSSSPQMFLETKTIFDRLTVQKMLFKTASGEWKVKEPLTLDDHDELRWFNIALIRDAVPQIFMKTRQGNEREQHIALRLLAQLTQPQHLRQLSPVFADLINTRYQQGAVVKGFGSLVVVPEQNPWSSMTREVETLVKAIAGTLNVDDLNDWLNKISADRLSWLFIEDVIRRKGGEIAAPFLDNATFHIQVHDENHRLLADATFTLPLDKESRVVLPSQAADYYEHRITVTPRLDREKWWFRLEPVAIDLKPYGVGFSAHVPFSGVYEISMTEPLLNVKKNLQWSFRHVP